MQPGFRMIVPAAVDFDHELRAVMDEVGDIAANRRLAAYVKIEGAEGLPEDPFADGHFLAETTRAFDGAG